MESNIKVRAKESIKVYDNKGKNLLGEILENKVYEAVLYKETEEYFVYDHQNREIFVGELDLEGRLKLSEEFERVECPICGNEGFIKTYKYCVNPDKHHGIRKEFLSISQIHSVLGS